MDRREAEALDRWLTTDPRDTNDECPECGGCEWVEVDCHDGGAWECHVGWLRDGEYWHGIRVCRREFAPIYHSTLCPCGCGIESEHGHDDYEG